MKKKIIEIKRFLIGENWNIYPLILLVFLTSILIYKYFGALLVIAYITLVIGLKIIIQKIKFGKKTMKIVIYLVIISTIISQIIIIQFIAPKYAGRIDRNNMLIATSQKVIEGKTPYDATWWVVFPDHKEKAIGRVNVLPFTILFAIPFYLIGNIAYQEVLAYVVILFLLLKRYKNVKNKLLVSLLFGGSPIIIFDIIGLNDLLVGISLLFLAIYLAKKKKDIWVAITMVCAFLTRPIFLVMSTPFIGVFLKKATWRRVIKLSLTAVIISLMLFMPFYMMWGGKMLKSVFGNDSGKFLVEKNPLLKQFPNRCRAEIITITIMILFFIIGYAGIKKERQLYLATSLSAGLFLGIMYFIRLDIDYSQLIWIASPLFFAFKETRRLKNEEK